MSVISMLCAIVSYPVSLLTFVVPTEFSLSLSERKRQSASLSGVVIAKVNAGRPCYNLSQNYFLSKRANSTSQTSSSGKRLGANFDSFLVSSIFKTILQNLVSHNRVSYGRKGNFRVVFCLCVRTKVYVRNLSCKNVFTQLVPFHSIQTHFHIKSFAREL